MKSQIDAVDELQTSLTDLLITLDSDNLLYTTDEGDLTLAGVFATGKIVAEEVETDLLNVDSVQVETTGDAAIAGQSVIAEGESEVVVNTTAINADSIVLVTPTVSGEESLAVSQINCDDDDRNCTGFTASVSKMLTNPLTFNWLIVNNKTISTSNEDNMSTEIAE